MRWWLIPLLAWIPVAEAVQHPIGASNEFEMPKRKNVVACKTIGPMQTYALRVLKAGTKTSDEAAINQAVAATNDTHKSTTCFFFKNVYVNLMFIETEWHTKTGIRIMFYRVHIDPGGSYIIVLTKQ